jgi:hypothetical protein
MGHPQKKTPLITDNNTAHGLTQGTMIPKRSKAMDMRFHWLKDRACQGQFKIKWKKGSANKADYPSKHHPPTVHQTRRQQFLVNAAQNENSESATAVQNGIKTVVQNLRVVLRHQVRTRGCAKANPGAGNKVTRIGAEAAGRMNDRRPSPYVTGKYAELQNQSAGTRNANDNSYIMSPQNRIG